MHSRIAALILPALLALAPNASASGEKEPKVSITFHIETDANDNPKMIFPQQTNGQQRFYRRVPDISAKDIASFNPFPSDAGGDDYGIVFKLKGPPTNRLAALTAVNQGRWMLSQLNGRPVDGVMIDKQINDGVLVIWKGVKLADINILDKEFTRTGEAKKKN